MSTQERIKKRREYLKQKGGAYIELIGSGVCFALIAYGSIYLVIFVYLAQTPMRHDHPIRWRLGLVGLTLGMVILLYSVWKGIKQNSQVLQIPYVPPVTADALPAEEVLVRGSVEPAQEQSRVLLRGTDGSADTGERDLLRGSSPS